MCSTTARPRPVGIGLLGANLHETAASKNLRRPNVVLRSAGEQRPGRFHPQELFQRGRGKPFAPSCGVDPVGDLTGTLHHEAGNRSHQTVVIVDRAQSHGRVVMDPLIVDIKCSSVRRICGGEGRHLRRPRIALPRAQQVEIGVIKASKCDRHLLIMTARSDSATVPIGDPQAEPPTATSRRSKRASATGPAVADDDRPPGRCDHTVVVWRRTVEVP